MERRKFKRFRTYDNSYAALQGNYTKVGKIYDINLKGLAFRYLAEKICDETFNHVDIFLSFNGFHLYKVPCTIVCDEIEFIYNSTKMTQYRCCLKFEELNEEQKNKLEFFVKNYTTDKV